MRNIIIFNDEHTKKIYKYHIWTRDGGLEDRPRVSRPASKPNLDGLGLVLVSATHVSVSVLVSEVPASTTTLFLTQFVLIQSVHTNCRKVTLQLEMHSFKSNKP